MTELEKTLLNALDGWRQWHESSQPGDEIPEALYATMMAAIHAARSHTNG